MQKFEMKHIDEASPEEVRGFAVSFLGLDIKDGDDASEVMAKVRAAHDSDQIFVQNLPVEEQGQTGHAPLPVESGNGAGLVGSLGRDDPKVRLTIHAEEKDGVIQNRHKEVGVNGRVWLLKRGESIVVPYRVFEALRNAERHIITMDTEGTTHEQVVKATPYSVEVMPTADEIDQWHKKTDTMFVP